MGVIEISPKVAAMLVLGFLACVAGFGKVLLAQFEKRMEERFKAQEKEAKAEADRLSDLSDEVRELSRTLPLEYVRREDWIRFSAAIDHKLDRLAELVMELKSGGSRARD